jgi:membrane-associated phospholipid phosphatase
MVRWGVRTTAAFLALLAVAPAGAEEHPDAGNPDAQPKIEKAEEAAKKAELTPIVPSPKDITKPAFQLYAEIDLPVLGIGLIFGTARLFRTQKAFCAPLCDPSDLNSVDRLTAGFYSTEWATASDLGLYLTAAGAATFLAVDEGVLPALNDIVVVAESALSATALSSMMTLAAGRPRPFLYGTNAPESTRNSADASLSYLSSHTSVTSAIASSVYMATLRLHPRSSLPTFVLVAGIAATVFVGTARVEAGSHFITDAIGGGIVGGSLGFLIPALHGTPIKVVPVVNEQQKGIGVSGRF